MTTVFARRSTGEMWSDSRITTDSGTVFRTRKIFRVGGSLFGGAGCFESFMSLVRAMEDGTVDEFSADGDFDALELDGDGRMWLWGMSGKRLEILDDVWGIGSGGVAAMCMMDKGIAPMEVLDVISRHDPATSGPFTREEV